MSFYCALVSVWFVLANEVEANEPSKLLPGRLAVIGRPGSIRNIDILNILTVLQTDAIFTEIFRWP